MSSPNENQEMMTRIALVEKEITLTQGLLQRFDITLEKMTDISTGLQRMLAIHDRRFNELERAEQMMNEQADRQREEFLRKTESLTKEVKDMGTDLRDEIGELGETMKSSLKEVQTSNKEMMSSFDTKYKDIEKRVNALENWRWLTLGGAGVLGFLLAKWPAIAALFTAAAAG